MNTSYQDSRSRRISATFSVARVFQNKASLLRLVIAVAASAFIGNQQVCAANGSWNVDALGSWVTAGDPPWLGSVVPGATSGSANTDVATFGFTLTAARTVTVDANRNIGGITFSNTSAFGYTLSGGPLVLSNGGVIQLTGSGAHSETIVSNVTIGGDGGSATFTNNSTAGAFSGRLLFDGNLAAAASTTATILTLNGSAAGSNRIGGVISGKLAIVMDAPGYWALNNHNTFSGGVTFNQGTLGFVRSDAFGNGTLTINGGTLGWNNNVAAETVSNAIVVGGDFAVSKSLVNAFALAFSGTMDLGAGTRTITASTDFTLSGVISNGALTKAGGGTVTVSGANAYTGDTTVTAGTLVLAAGSQTSFDIGASGTNNKILGTAGGTEAITLDGDFAFNLAGAGTGLGDSWNIVDMINVTPTFGATFSVLGFTDNLDNTWSKLNGGVTYQFSESTGVLSVIPEPSTWFLLAMGLTVVVTLRLRRRHS